MADVRNVNCDAQDDETFTICLPRWRIRQLRAKADRAGLTLEEWCKRFLLEKARQELVTRPRGKKPVKLSAELQEAHAVACNVGCAKNDPAC